MWRFCGEWCKWPVSGMGTSWVGHPRTMSDERETRASERLSGPQQASALGRSKSVGRPAGAVKSWRSRASEVCTDLIVVQQPRRKTNRSSSRLPLTTRREWGRKSSSFAAAPCKWSRLVRKRASESKSSFVRRSYPNIRWSLGRSSHVARLILLAAARVARGPASKPVACRTLQLATGPPAAPPNLPLD